jgi:hypothetical protein
MTAIYEFTCFLRIPAEGAEEARDRARALADAVSHGEATLALDDSEPSIDESDDEDSAQVTPGLNRRST